MVKGLTITLVKEAPDRRTWYFYEKLSGLGWLRWPWREWIASRDLIENNFIDS
jgi:hypothetical protein